MKHRILSVFSVCFVLEGLLFGQEATQSPSDPDPGKLLFLDTSYSFEERAADLVSRMTPEEKQSQLGNAMLAVPRLGINAYSVWGEALHGVVSSFITREWPPKPTTSFPNSVALGASWDPTLVEKVATAISDEARGLNAEVIRNLTFWSPVVEPMRDPRWGRNGESYGEDPFLISNIASGFIRGLMGNDPKYLKASPTGKHYLANNSEFNRHTGNSELDERDLREYYITPYKHLIEREQLPSIMTCYNRVNGEPVTGSRYFVDTVARKTYGLDGYVTGDCGAVEDIFAGHKYRANKAEATALALRAGVDTDCGNIYQRSALEALQKGLADEADIDRALRHMFTMRMRFGEFDPDDQVPYKSIGPDVVASEEHAALAAEAATKTPVLLKNEVVPRSRNKALPLDTKLRKIAVLGPQADRVELGPYSGFVKEEQRISPLAGIRRFLQEKRAATEVVYAEGATASPRWNLVNISWFEVVKSDGSTRRYNAVDYSEASPEVQIAGSGNDSRIRNLNDGSWVSYLGVDLAGATKLNLHLSVPGDGGTVELRVGSLDGDQLAVFDVEGGTGMFRNRTLSADLEGVGVREDQPIYFVCRARPQPPISDETLELAKSADAAVVFVGTDDRTAGEEGDRPFLALPGNQVELIRAVAEVNPRTIVVMQTLGVVEIEEFRSLGNVSGILWYGFNGQGQGDAVARILFGEAVPAGKLNFTWYKSMADLPEFTNYKLRGVGGNPRTYWYFDGDVSYEFGYGLSYTTFEYSNIRADKARISPDESVTISVDVRNTGRVTADEVVQVYVRTPDSPAERERPLKRLRGFQRVSIPAGRTQTVAIEIPGTDLWFWDPVQDRLTFDEGRHVFEVGSSSRDIRGSVEVEMQGRHQLFLKNVTLDCHGVVLSPGDRIPCDVTAVLSDDHMLDRSAFEVRFASNRPNVAAVDTAGTVTAQATGLATITAEVTYEGKTLASSQPLKVQPVLSLEDLRVDGKRPKGFDSDRHGYSFLLPSGTSRAPRIEATLRNQAAVMEVSQAASVPGTALVTVSDPTMGQAAEYAVYFGAAVTGDDFKESLGSHWRWIRGNPADWTIDRVHDSLVITARDGDLKGASNSAANLLLQSANADWVVESKMTFSRTPSLLDQQGGLIAYEDDDNYVKLVYDRASHGFAGIGNYLELVVERNGVQYLVANTETESLFDCERSIVFRLEKEGSRYRGYYSKDGINFTLLGETDVVLRDVQAGILAVNGDPESRGPSQFAALLGQREDTREEAPFEVTVDYFQVRSQGRTLP